MSKEDAAIRRLAAAQHRKLKAMTEQLVEMSEKWDGIDGLCATELEELADACRKAAGVVAEHAAKKTYMAFDADTPLGPRTIIVLTVSGMSDADAHGDAQQILQSMLGSHHAGTVSAKGRKLKKLPDDAWPDGNSSGWGFVVTPRT